MKKFLITLSALAVFSSLFSLSATVAPSPVQASKCSLTTAKKDLKDFNGNPATGANYMLTGSNMNTVKITNTSSSCIYSVGIASYKAYENYTTSVKSQEYYASQTKTLGPKQSWTYTVNVPKCAYQVDVFYGSLLKNFKTTNYSAQGRLLDAYFYPDGHRNTPYCQKASPTPKNVAKVSPTPTPAPTPTPTSEATPSATPTTPAAIITPTPSPTPLPSPTPTASVLGITELPSTGPGIAVAIALLGLLGGLMAKKYHLFDRGHSTATVKGQPVQLSSEATTPKPKKYQHNS